MQKREFVCSILLGGCVSGEIEEKACELAEVKAGLQFKAGHPVHLIVNGIKGSRRYGRPKQDSHGTAGGAAALAPGTPGGVKDGKFEIEMQLHAAGGTPLIAERVRVHDPDTGKPVGDDGVTDEEGVLRARVPEEKEYEIHIVAEGGEEHPDAFDDHVHPLPAHLPHPDEHPLLHVIFLDAKGEPLKGEPVKVNDEHGTAQEVKTDYSGVIDMVVEAGPFMLELRSRSFQAHSVFSGDLVEEGAPYKFVVQ